VEIVRFGTEAKLEFDVVTCQEQSGPRSGLVPGSPWASSVINAIRVSEHLCWTGVASRNTHDLLPLPLDERTLAHVVERVGVVLDLLERPLILETPAPTATFTGFAELCSRRHRRLRCSEPSGSRAGWLVDRSRSSQWDAIRSSHTMEMWTGSTRSPGNELIALWTAAAALGSFSAVSEALAAAF